MAKKRKYIPKKIREQVYQKYGGRCAYCGREIKYEDMQVDHYIPHRRITKENFEEIEALDNYMPSCRACNYYKRARNIESMRKSLSQLCKQLEKSFDYRLAKKYGLITETPHKIIYYFEKMQDNDE